MGKLAVMPVNLTKDKGAREMSNQSANTPDSGGTMTIDSVMSNLDSALDELETLDAKLAERMRAVLNRTASSIRAKRVATAMANDAGGLCTYMAIGGKELKTFSANIHNFYGVRTAMMVDKDTVSFTATPEAAQKVAFAFPEIDIIKASALICGPQHPPAPKPVVQARIRREDSARTAAAKVEMQFASVPGVFGVKESFGKVIVACDRDLPASCRNAIRDLATPYDVRFAQSKSF